LEKNGVLFALEKCRLSSENGYVWDVLAYNLVRQGKEARKARDIADKG
jgi:hypothetical protein